MNNTLKKWLEIYEYNVTSVNNSMYSIRDLQLDEMETCVMPQLLIRFIDQLENKLCYEDDHDTDWAIELKKDICTMQQELINMELKYEDIHNYKRVYVTYDKTSSTWGEETRQSCIDGVEDVFIDDTGRVYTVDKNGSKLTDLDHYIECDGIKVYSL